LPKRAISGPRSTLNFEINIQITMLIFRENKIFRFSPAYLKTHHPGTDVMILEIFSQKKIAKKLAFLTRNKAKLCKFLIIPLDFEKNANFFPKISKNR
jgi:hypothetical protein